MEASSIKTIIFRNQEFQVHLQQEICSHFPQETLVSFLFNGKYTIKADVRDEVFNSFIQYFNNQTLPNITHENIDEYAQLNQEFQVPSINQLIQSKSCELHMSNPIEEELLLPNSIRMDNLDYELDHKNFTAKAKYIKSKRSNLKFHIPRSIQINSKDYLVTDFSWAYPHIDKQEYSNSISSLSFSEDSIITKVDLSHFSYIDNLSIPPSVNELIIGNFDIKNIKISPNNHNLNYDGTFIYGKSNQRVDEFDTLVFAHRNIEKVSIQPNIKLIKSFCFAKSKLKEIDFANNSNLCRIEKFAFYGCDFLEKISIHSNVNSIEMNAFNSAKLKTIEFSQSSKLSYIGFGAFTKSLIESITIPESATMISDNAFYGCESLKSVTFSPNSNLQIIGNFSFTYTRIESITIPEKVTKIGDYAFNNCFNLKTVTFSPNSNLQIIGNYSFTQTKIESITIPKKVTKIEDHAFFECFELKTVDYENGSALFSVGECAFLNAKIERIEFPSSLRVLKGGFGEKTKCILAPPNNNYIQCIDNILYEKSNLEMDSFDMIVFANKDIENALIPSNIKYIEQYSFYKCPNLKKVEFSPNSQLQIIGSLAFYQSTIESIIIPSSVTSIEELAFLGCKNLHHVEFSPNSQLQIIGSSAFKQSAIESIIIPSSVTSINYDTFRECENLHHVEFSPNSQLQIINYSAFKQSAIESIIIPSSVTSIDSDAFSECKNLHHVEFSPNSQLQIINYSAFKKSAIESIIIPSSVTSIECEAFSECENLHHVEFSPNSQLQIINEYAFYESPIGSITIPRNVKKIERYAFYSCSLTKFDFENKCEIPCISPGALEKNANHIEINVPKGSKIDESIFGKFKGNNKINFI